MYARTQANSSLIHLSKCWFMFYYVYSHFFFHCMFMNQLTSDSQTMQLNYKCSQLLHVTLLACVVSIWLMWLVTVINKYNSNEFFFFCFSWRAGSIHNWFLLWKMTYFLHLLFILFNNHKATIFKHLSPSVWFFFACNSLLYSNTQKNIVA